jgi:hypothetical protein
MDRRAFITMAGGSMFAAPLAAQAQPGKVYRVGILSLNARADSLPLTEALEQGLRDRGYVVAAILLWSIGPLNG